MLHDVGNNRDCDVDVDHRNNTNINSTCKQELSYRKQIMRQLRTQFVEGIYRSDYA